MTAAEARAIAEEQIALWRRHGLPAYEAWNALTPEHYWGGGWDAVRVLMVRWLLSRTAPGQKPRLKRGPLPAVPMRRAA
jgi:hypothetical protein